MKSFLLFLLFLFLLRSQSSFAQAGAIDSTFNPTDVGHANGYGADGKVDATVLQHDGRIIIGGEFYNYDGVSRNKIARLNPDGSLDASFDPGTGMAGTGGYVATTVYAIAVQTDGKIIVGGYFTEYNGIPRNNIARLNSDGSLDTSFNPGTGADNQINEVAIQTDGKILIAGYFQYYDGIPNYYIARLNTNGSLDTSFHTGEGTNQGIGALCIQQDGRILIGGEFTVYNGTIINHVARLNADGSLDASFYKGLEAYGYINSMVIQQDGKIIIAGDFYYEFNDTWRSNIARLNADGTLDNNFDAGDAAGDIPLYTVALQNDGRIIAGGGRWSYWYGPVEDLLIRLNSNGTKDPNFYTPSLDGNTHCLAIQSNGEILVGGSFQSINLPEINIHRLKNNGTPDASFDAGTGANDYVLSIIILQDRRILISGGFTSFNGLAESQIARLNVNGTPDSSFHVNDPLYVQDISLQNDGKIVAATAYPNVKRFNANGRIDPDFTETDLNGAITKTAVQYDGKILAGGNNLNYYDGRFNSIIRLNANGTIDPAFNSTTTQNGWVADIVIQPNNKIIIVGGGWQQTSTPFEILRLNYDGSRDVSFLRGAGADGQISKVVIQNNGKILIGGSFTIFNENNINYLARLNSDGSLDTSFNSGTGPDNSIFAIAIQNDGKILIGGDFGSYNGVPRNKIARLNSDGTLDSSFNPGNGANGTIRSIAIQSDGKILIGGGFTAFNGTGRNRIARLLGIGSTAAHVSIAITTGTNPSCSGQPVTFTASPTNGGSSPTYQWKVNGNNVGMNTRTYTTDSLTGGQVVNCVMTSSLANGDPSIATSNSIIVNEPVMPVASIAVTSGSNSSCAGQSLTFAATLTNGGDSPTYQWKVNGNNIGINSPASTTYTTNALTNGQVITCAMTSTLACANRVTIISNPIAMSVNSCSPSAQPPDWTWAKKSVGIKTDYSWRIAKDKNDNLYVAGLFSGDSIQFGRIVLHTPGGGMFVVKYDASGNAIWGRTDAGNANSDAISIATDQSGNVYVAGTFSGPSITFGNITLNRTLNDYFDTYLVKFDSTGNAIWAESATGDRWSVPYGIAVDNSGNIYMTGQFWSTSMNFSGTVLDNANPWNYVNMFLVKYTSAGNVVWANRSESYNFATYADGIAVDSSGNIYVTGSFKGDYYYYRDSLKFGKFTLYNNSGGETPNYYIVKYDPSGTVLWANGADEFTGWASGNSLSTDKWGNAYVTGEFAYNSIRFGNSVLQYGGSNDIFIAKYDPSGKVKWAKGLSSPGYKHAEVITNDNDGNVYLGGYFTNNNINIGGIEYNNANPGSSDILLVKCDSSGNFLWTKTAGGKGGDGVSGIVIDANKNLYVSGLFYSSTVTFGCTELLNSDSTGQTSDLYIARIGESGTSIMPAISIARTSGTDSICQGQPVTFTATPTNSGTNPFYQWKVNGNDAGTNSPTYITNTLTNGQVLSCVMTSISTAACSNLVTVTSNPITINCVAPAAVTIAITSGTNPTCAGTNVVFTATPTNGGDTPVYQWKLNGASVGTNSNTYQNATLTNGAKVTCVMTSSLPGANPTTAVSNEITMTRAQLGSCLAVKYPNTKKSFVKTYHLRAANTDGNKVQNKPADGVIQFTPKVVAPAIPDIHIHPNPANQNTIITFYLEASARISIDVFNIAGQQFGIIENRVLSSGNQTIPWNTEKFSAGVYFVRLRTDNYSTAKKIIVIH